MKQPKIFYFCFSDNQSSGGSKEIYRHVEILTKYGYQAFVLHTQRDFKITWFNHQVEIIDLEIFQNLFDSESDFLVFPEDLGNDILSFPGKKLIFNQNIYYGFETFSLQKSALYPYLHSDVKGALVVSEHNQEPLKFAYPELDIFRIYYGVDAEKFPFQPLSKKKKRLPAIPPKGLSIAYFFITFCSRDRNRA